MGFRASATQDLSVLKVPALLKERTGFPELGGQMSHCILNELSALWLGLQTRVVFKSVFFKQGYMKIFVGVVQALAVLKKLVFRFAT